MINSVIVLPTTLCDENPTSSTLKNFLTIFSKSFAVLRQYVFIKPSTGFATYIFFAILLCLPEKSEA